MNAVVKLRTQGRVAVIEIASPPVNALSHSVRKGVLESLGVALADPGVDAIVLMGSGRIFSAGADISELGKPLQEPLHPQLFGALEHASKPVVAAIHGTALGGGFEMALSCHYRIALSGAKVGLPEVLLGLLPGAGGTQRLPRLVGVQAALPLMVSGQSVDVSKAAQMGAIDEVAETDLPAAAVAYAQSLVDDGAPLRKVRDLDIDPGSVPADFYDQFRASIARKARGYFAPERIITAVQASVELDFEAGLKRERELFRECMESPESAALRHAFFAHRAINKVPGISKDTAVRPVNSVAVIGAGTMGGGIAMNFANRGIPVYVVDVDIDAIQRGLTVVRRNYERGVLKGRMTQTQLEALMKLFIPATDYTDLAGVDLVIEAVFENMALKKTIFSRLDEVCKPGAILASNTSTLDVDEIAQSTGRPQDVVGLHFFSPANIMRLLEIVRGAKTSTDVLATVMGLSKKIGKVGVVSGVCYGFIGNRMLEGYGREAGLLCLEGATPGQIDRAVFNFGFPMGPMAMSDLAGIDVGAKVRQERRLAGTLPDDPRFGVVADKLAAMGRWGQKTGAGFYRYEAGSRTPQPDPEVETLIRQEAERLGIEQRDISDEEIVARCLYPMINEGALILEEGIALRASDIDVVWINGYGFPPYRGGPMHYADSIGLDTIYKQICHYRETLGDEFGYWEPAPLLQRLAKENGRFSDL